MVYAWLLWLFLVIDQDLRNRRVPNGLVVFGAAFGIAALLLKVPPFAVSGLDAMTGASAGFAFLLIFYAAGFMGAGDVKFAGALGLWVGLQPLLPIWIGASLLAGVHAALWLMLQRWPAFPRLAQALSGVAARSYDGAAPPKKQRHIPFAAYLAIASVGWLFWRGPGL